MSKYCDVSGSNPIAEDAFPLPLKTIRFDSKFLIAIFTAETFENPEIYFRVWTRILYVKNRFLPAILIEFPNDAPWDWKYANMAILLMTKPI
jgi:hypothetical protein